MQEIFGKVQILQKKTKTLKKGKLMYLKKDTHTQIERLK